jgi:hypothetical protein
LKGSLIALELRTWDLDSIVHDPGNEDPLLFGYLNEDHCSPFVARRAGSALC